MPTPKSAPSGGAATARPPADSFAAVNRAALALRVGEIADHLNRIESTQVNLYRLADRFTEAEAAPELLHFVRLTAADLEQSVSWCGRVVTEIAEEAGFPAPDLEGSIACRPAGPVVA